MGTVWRLTLDILPDYETSYAFFRAEAMEKIMKRFGLLSYVWTTIDRDLPLPGLKKRRCRKRRFLLRV